MSLIAKIFDLSRNAFGMSHSSNVVSEKILELSKWMDKLTPRDLNMDENNLMKMYERSSFRYGKPANKLVWCHSIGSTKDFTIAVFVLPKNTSIPLHDHPKMTVLSKLIFGEVKVKAFDWISPSSVYEDPNSSHPAKLVTNDQVIAAPSNVRILYPTDGGNLHSFSAVTNCAFFDILAPPYSSPQRECRYYQEKGKTDSGNFLLQQFSPEDFDCVGGAPLFPEDINTQN